MVGFSRLAAIFIGLASLGVLAALNDVGIAARRGDITLDYALTVLLAVILPGLGTRK